MSAAVNDSADIRTIPSFRGDNQVLTGSKFQAVKNKEIDMKGAAELLGVSYGTLYGRYR